MSNIRTVEIMCEITNEDKEEEGSFTVELLREGRLLYRRQHWGLQEGWDDGTTQSTTSNDISDKNAPARGNYLLRVRVDMGVDIDVSAKWSVSVLTTDGETLVSDTYAELLHSDDREFQWQFAL